jgi:hypothetical protein
MPEKDLLELSPSRRSFLKSTALVAAAASASGVSPAEAAPVQAQAAAGTAKDMYALAARYNKFLRITDVTDGLDAVGRADLTLMDPAIRPLWMGMRFFGPAVTMRVVPTNHRMPLVAKGDALKQHDIWGKMGDRKSVV